MYLAILYYALGSTCVFIQHNLQFINPWWKDKQIYLILVLSIPTSLFYLNAWTYFIESTKSAWTAKFVFFGMSYFIFPILTYTFLNESPFTLKTLMCTILSILILLIQYKM